MVWIACFVAFSLLEYGLHRFPMHRKLGRWNYLYDHVHQHHVLWYREGRLKYLFLPPEVIAVLLAIGLAGWALTDWRFPVTLLAYYLIYEAVHFSHHKFGWRTGAHHRKHHDDASGNFGITSPIWDRVFKTLLR